MRKLFASFAVLALVAGVPVAAQTRGDQASAREEMKAGNVHSLREIERRVLPTMPGAQYLGPEYDRAAMVYRLKFIREGRVTFVDVDARTARVLRVSR